MIDIMKQGLGHRTPQQEAVPKGQEFSGIENLWPRDGSCPHVFDTFKVFSFLKLHRSFVIIDLKEGGHHGSAIFRHSV